MKKGKLAETVVEEGEDAQGVEEKKLYMVGGSCPLFFSDCGVCGIEIMTFFVSLMCSFFL